MSIRFSEKLNRGEIMKKVLALALIGVSFQGFAKDKVDYSYCQDTFTPKLNGSWGGHGNGVNLSSEYKDFPFKLGDDGKVTPHKDVKYKYDEKTKTETMSFVAGPKEFGSKQEVIIKRDKQGHISQVISNSSYEGMKTKTGLGSKKFPFGGGGMYGPGIGVGYPGGGGGFGMGGYGMGGPSKFSIVHDVKIKSGKCFPYRSVQLSEVGNNTHKSFGSDAYLCRDLKKFYQEQDKDDSKLGKLKACYDSYQKEAQKVISAHKKRNDDLYNPKDEMEDDNPWKQGGYFGDLGEGQFSSGEAGYPGGGGGYGHPGGFAGSIDNIVESKMFNSAEKAKQLSVFCNFPYGPMKDIIGDDSLFKKELRSDASAEGSQKDGSTKQK